MWIKACKHRPFSTRRDSVKPVSSLTGKKIPKLVSKLSSFFSPLAGTPVGGATPQRSVIYWSSSFLLGGSPLVATNWEGASMCFFPMIHPMFCKVNAPSLSKSIIPCPHLSIPVFRSYFRLTILHRYRIYQILFPRGKQIEEEGGYSNG
jgi:hypothetical protein